MTSDAAPRKVDYRQVIHVLFDDIVNVARTERPAFEALYYNRTREITQLCDYLSHVGRNGHNILITGGAGVGKSTFVHKVLLDEGFIQRSGLHPILVDYRKRLDRDLLLLDFVDDFSGYLAKIGWPANDLKANTAENFQANRNILVRHYTEIQGKEKSLPKHPVIFLDDFDYIEEEQLFPILNLFLPLATGHVTMILTARPALLTAVGRHDDRLANYFLRCVDHVKLKPLPVDRLIARRLACILKEDAAHPFVAGLISRWRNRKDPLRRWLRQMDIESIEALPALRLPFDALFCNFVSSITSGNIRDVLRIAEVAFEYVLSNELVTVVENCEGQEIERKQISEEAIMAMFGEASSGGREVEEPPTFQILNLFHARSKKGTALYFNVLEGVQAFGAASPECFDLLEEMGHSESNVRHALSFLKNRPNVFIEDKGLFPVGTRPQAELHWQYNLTLKGSYYLSSVVHWPSYIERYGEAGPSLIDLVRGKR